MSRDAAPERVRRVARLLDSAVRIPGTDYRVGLDPVLGLVPGVGDVVALVASLYVVLEAARLGLPRATLARMVVNVGVDALVGAVPLVGDAFDAVWKANDRNVELLEARLSDPEQGHRDRRFLLATVLALVVAAVAIATAVLALVAWLFSTLGGA